MLVQLLKIDEAQEFGSRYDNEEIKTEENESK